MAGPVRKQSWDIAGWRIVQWEATESTTEFAIGEAWFTIAKDHLEPDAYQHDYFMSIHEAMVAVVALTYLPHDGMDALGQAFTFARTIGMHRLAGGEWVLVPPPEQS